MTCDLEEQKIRKDQIASECNKYVNTTQQVTNNQSRHIGNIHNPNGYIYQISNLITNDQTFTSIVESKSTGLSMTKVVVFS